MLNPSDTVLAVIDVQGKLAQLMHDKDTLFANLGRMIQGAQALNLPILWTEQVPAKLGPTTPHLAQLLAPNVQPLHKICFSCYGESQFVAALKATGRQTVLITGIETHICVYQTTRDLLAAGYGVEVVQDAVSSRVASNKTAGLARMKDLGANLSTTEMSLFELLGTAEAAQFRTISRLVK